jgi:16S rRNA (cytosine1402-N4)-methyltransferase
MLSHVPVLVGPALEYLEILPNGLYLDATFGAGGHAAAILEGLGDGRLIALDADPRAAAAAQRLADPRLTFVHANFRDLSRVLDRYEIPLLDGVLFDLGVSSMQLDDAERGFSLGKPSVLDMRMDPTRGSSAYDVLLTATERELAEIFFAFGEERSARRIARVIVTRREGGALPNTTSEFAALISGILQRPGKRERIHPATRVFQALRIAVNDELDALREGLAQAIVRLRTGGRVVVISFHSLEDRIVKRSFRGDERLEVLTKKPIRPDGRELVENRRSRSAKLRAAQRRGPNK